MPPARSSGQPLRIVAIDPADEAAITTFHDIYTQVGHADRADAFYASPLSETIDVLRFGTERYSYAAFLGYIDDVAVASGWCAADVKDDLQLVQITPRVLPHQRRRGYGSLMLGRCERHARELGRTVLGAGSTWETRFGPDGAGSGAIAFARRHGWSLGLTEAMSMLALPVDSQELDALAARAAQRHAGYVLRAWDGPVPDAIIDQWAQMEAALSTEAPQGDLGSVADTPSVAAIRDDERIQAQSGTQKFNAIATGPAGDVAGYTSIAVVAAPRSPADQWETLVRQEHRGHRLGLALKVAVLRELQTQRPDISATVTENAVTNEHMLAVNDQLGYKLVAYRGRFRKRF